jgi:small-conductance mechanosensitive channel
MDPNAVVLGNSLLAWFTALGVALSINLFVALGKPVLVARFSRTAPGTPRVVGQVAVEVAQRTRQGLVFIVSAFVVTRYLDLPERATDLLRGAAVVAAFLQLGLWCNGALLLWMGRYRERVVKADVGATTSLGALGFVGQLLLWAFVVLLALGNLGVDVTALIAGLGIGGIAVALAAQNILGDLFASLSIIVDRPFVIGDFIIVDDYMGTVEYVGLKTTRIRSLGGEQIVFSNSDLLKARVRNYKRMYERRVLFSFGLLYQTTPEQAESVPRTVRRIVESQKLTRFERAHFARFGDSSLDFEAVYWMTDPDYGQYMDTQQAINLEMLRAFAKEGIRFAYPTRTLFVENALKVETAALRGDGHDHHSDRETRVRPS